MDLRKKIRLDKCDTTLNNYPQRVYVMARFKRAYSSDLPTNSILFTNSSRYLFVEVFKIMMDRLHKSSQGKAIKWKVRNYLTFILTKELILNNLVVEVPTVFAV